MAWGAGLALALIYLVLAFVFASYGWPLVVMSVIPFGLVGAVFGHWLMGIDLTILSMFGFFGLSGIVVNDSIILVSFYKEMKRRGFPWRNSIVGCGLLPVAGGAAHLAHHHRRPHSADVRDLGPGAVPDPDGGVHRVRSSRSPPSWCCCWCPRC